MPELKAGARLKSAVCTTEVIVVKTPSGNVDVTCGGVPMVAANETVERGTPKPDAAATSASQNPSPEPVPRARWAATT